MTREERVDWLCRLRCWVVPRPNMTVEQKSKCIEALTEVIDDLQTEPCVSELSYHEDKMKVLEKIKAEMQDIIIVSKDEERIYQEISTIIYKHIKAWQRFTDQIEPCEDYISRSELLKAINTWDKFGCDADTKLVPYQDNYIPYIHYDDVVKCIKSMPPVQPAQKWIPVSERLPNFNDIVLASADSNYGELRVIITVYSAEEFWFNGKIKAWMPLPEPYKAESEVK